MSNQISEQEFSDAIIATKKDAKLVAAAKNDRMNSPEALYREFLKLPVDRQKEIIGSVANEQFVGAQWKVAFPLNNLPAANAADAVGAAGKALFFTRDEDSVKETVRALKLYQDSRFYKTVATSLGEAAEIVRSELATVAQILTHPELYGMIQNLDPEAPVSEKLVLTIVRVASYTRDLNSTLNVARFLQARRHSKGIESIATLMENTLFMARDRKSVREILAGFGAGSVDRVLQRHSENKDVLSGIRDIAWKTRNADAIRNYLEQL
jgi:hypothetical protein